VTITGRSIGSTEIGQCPPDLLAEVQRIARQGKATGAKTPAGDTPPENRELVKSVKLSGWLRSQLTDPYQDGPQGERCDRGKKVFRLARAMRHEGLTKQQALELLCDRDGKAFAPALDRRDGDIAAARVWMWRYAVAPAYQPQDHNR
jgi:hypothetical protein